MPDPFDPREALAAVERLEQDLDEVRRRARRPQMVDVDALRHLLAQRSAADRAQAVDDLGAVLDALEHAWRAHERGHGDLAAGVRGLGGRLDHAAVDLAGGMLALRDQLGDVSGDVGALAAALPTTLRDELAARAPDATAAVRAAVRDELAAQIPHLAATVREALRHELAAARDAREAGLDARLQALTAEVAALRATIRGATVEMRFADEPAPQPRRFTRGDRVSHPLPY